MNQEELKRDAKEKQKILGKNLKKLRSNVDENATRKSERKITQEEMGELLGVSRQYYGEIERGHLMPKFDVLAKICVLFDTDLNYLFGLNKAKKTKEQEISNTIHLTPDSVRFLSKRVENNSYPDEEAYFTSYMVQNIHELYLLMLEMDVRYRRWMHAQASYLSLESGHESIDTLKLYRLSREESLSQNQLVLSYKKTLPEKSSKLPTIKSETENFEDMKRKFVSHMEASEPLNIKKKKLQGKKLAGEEIKWTNEKYIETFMNIHDYENRRVFEYNLMERIVELFNNYIDMRTEEVGFLDNRNELPDWD